MENNDVKDQTPTLVLPDLRSVRIPMHLSALYFSCPFHLDALDANNTKPNRCRNVSDQAIHTQSQDPSSPELRSQEAIPWAESFLVPLRSDMRPVAGFAPPRSRPSRPSPSPAQYPRRKRDPRAHSVWKHTHILPAYTLHHHALHQPSILTAFPSNNTPLRLSRNPTLHSLTSTRAQTPAPRSSTARSPRPQSCPPASGSRPYCRSAPCASGGSRCP